ncbi:NAD(P)H-hydrate dehydratase [Sphingobacterium sp. Lzh-3]|uniref:NAD(P)H-hydrate dehydratase n=1 Tax=unclassified Sphingobacterium TaxID=2609468 RepID=UPI0029537FE7|nr:NAD(P)H-hydrate dehydratase [Sphingobacterium sp. UGAL515B_05]WON92994.1 NAD(P)H-hydrate dehydratase [Sphingobacterium sp. UGAL515B_05]
MKILSAQQINKIDSETLKDQKISGIDLMERAATVVFEEIKKRHPRLEYSTFFIFCGKGNNGGDGLVLARLLDQQQAQVKVYLIDVEDYSADNLANQKRLPNHIIQKVAAQDQVAIPSDAIVLDCLFGYGLKRVLTTDWSGIISSINGCGARIYSVDMPSGLLADRKTAADVPIVKADLVYTFQFPKLALLLPENQWYVKDFKVLDIDLSQRAIEAAETNLFYVDEPLVRSFYRQRRKFDHKGTFGHTLIIGGSKGKMGAVQLALKAALRAGCGLASAYVPDGGNTILQTAVSEAMVITDPEQDFISQFPAIDGYQSVGIGIGMGTAPQTIDALKVFITRVNDTPLVLDADALNILAREPNLWAFVPAHSILTPHPKELSRILGAWQDDFEKMEKVKVFARKHQFYVLIKGANSAMVMPDGMVYFNSTGNVGMATGGSGDILTGIITSLLGQGYSSKEALIMGVYIHGGAADIAVKTIGTYSLLPSDTISHLSNAFLELEKDYDGLVH